MIFGDNKIIPFPERLKSQMIDEIGKGKQIDYPERLKKQVALYTGNGQNTGRSIKETPTMRSFPLRERLMLDMDEKSETYLMPSPNGSMVTISIGTSIRVVNGFAEGIIPDRFRVPKILKSGDYELYWYLKYVCGYIENGEAGKLFPNRVKHFRIEDKAGDAKKKTNTLKTKSAVEYKLTASEAETGISDTKMIELAYVYRVASPKDRTREELAIEILGKVESDERVKDYSKGADLQGYAFFLSIVKDVTATRYRVLVQRSIDEEFITYDVNSGAWRFVNNKKLLGTPEYFGQPIVKVPPGRDHNEIILSKVKTDKEFFEALVSAIEVGEVVSSPIEDKDEDEMTIVERLEKQAKAQEGAGDFAGAIKTLEGLMKENASLKGVYAMKIGKLKNKLK